LEAVWRHPETDARLKKRIVRTLIEEVMVEVDPQEGEIIAVIHWKGGVHMELRIPRRRRGYSRAHTPQEIVNAVRVLVRICSDDVIAGALTRSGLVTGMGNLSVDRLESAVRKGRLVNPEKIDRRIGSILARHPGMSSWVCVRREELPAAAGETVSGNQKRAARPRQVVHWHVLQETQELVRQLEGVYLPRTNVPGTDAGQVWEDYVTLVRVENAFRNAEAGSGIASP
jgi:hypothetical protein